MKTQTFKAKDVKSAINLVNNEFGERAIIVSTKKNNGFVEIEASDNDDVIKNHQKDSFRVIQITTPWGNLGHLTLTCLNHMIKMQKLFFFHLNIKS